MRSGIQFLIVALFVVLAASLLYAQERVYTYVDEDGVIHFSDMPRAGAKEFDLGGGKKKARVVGSEVPFHELINASAERYGLDAALVAAVAQVESSFDPWAVSHAGAKGVMQLMDETAADYGVSDVFDPKQNIDAGARHLSDLLEAFEGNLKLSLAAYNAGRSAVLRHGGVPPYQETKRYIEKVGAIYDRVDGTISDSEIDNSYAAARAIGKRSQIIYRIEGPDGPIYTDVPPNQRGYRIIPLRH